MKKLIRLEDGILVEVEVQGEQVEQISGGLASKVSSKLEIIKPVLLNLARPIAEVWKEFDKDMIIEEAEIELGLSFEAEGNLYITKSKANSNISVTLKLKTPKKDAET